MFDILEDMQDTTEVNQPLQFISKRTEREITLKSGETFRLPSLQIDRAILYHGSSAEGIKRFEEGDQQTIGNGIYFTSETIPAIGYAVKRSGTAAKPTLYQAEIENLNLADLRERSAQEQFAKLYKEALVEWKNNVLPNLKYADPTLLEIIKEQRSEQVEELLRKIDNNDFNQLRDLTFGWASLITQTLQTQGYQGLVSIEGEEPFGFHDSYVIFNSDDIKSIKEGPVPPLI